MITHNRLLEFMDNSEVTDPMSVNLVLSIGRPRVQIIVPNAGSLKVILPDFRLLKLGGPHFYIVNIDTTNAITIESDNGQESFTLADTKVAVMSIFRGSGVKGWIAHIRDYSGSGIGALAP